MQNHANVSSRARTTLQIGRDILRNEAKAVKIAEMHLAQEFIQAVELLYYAKGKVILSGIGKSGIVARKIASTLSSTSTFSLFVHPVEALHGDIGVLQKKDVVIAISHSGETPEVLRFVELVKQNFNNKVIAITAHANSELAKKSGIALLTHVREEACKSCRTFNLAPTTSTLVTLAVGDALAGALQELKGVRAEHFAKAHPGGELGRKLERDKKYV